MLLLVLSRQVLNISKDGHHPVWVFCCSAPHCEAFSLHLMRLFHCVSCYPHASPSRFGSILSTPSRQEHSWTSQGFLCPLLSDSHSLSGGVSTASLFGILFFHPILNQALQHPIRNAASALTSQREIFIFLRLTMQHKATEVFPSGELP